MPEKMDPAFSGITAECRKCKATSDKIRSEYIEEKTGDEPKQERMKRICECGFEWHERPADAGDGPGG